MAKMPLVSVIIPAYNAEVFLRETIQSILDQTWGNLEIIVVDDGSTDTTAEIAKSFGAKIRYLFQENSGGCAVPRNNGIKHAQGDFLIFLDADDLLPPKRVEEQVRFLQQNAQVGLVFSDYVNFDENGDHPQTHFSTCPRLKTLLQDKETLVIPNACPILAEENFGIASSFMIRNEMKRYAEEFEPSLKSCEDFHFFYRIARHTPTGIINKVGMRRRMHDGNMSSHSSRMFEQGIRAYSWLMDKETNEEAKRLLKRKISRCWEGLARISSNRGLFLKSIWLYQKAFFCSPSVERLFCFIKGTVRALAIKVRAHRPDSI